MTRADYQVTPMLPGSMATSPGTATGVGPGPRRPTLNPTKPSISCPAPAERGIHIPPSALDEPDRPLWHHPRRRARVPLRQHPRARRRPQLRAEGGRVPVHLRRGSASVGVVGLQRLRGLGGLRGGVPVRGRGGGCLRRRGGVPVRRRGGGCLRRCGVVPVQRCSRQRRRRRLRRLLPRAESRLVGGIPEQRRPRGRVGRRVGRRVARRGRHVVVGHEGHRRRGRVGRLQRRRDRRRHGRGRGLQGVRRLP
ncbi:hypothetical protein DFJ74DRAFT_37380 [Hyaloraphidium curvatum]|nr:hypothetical protein DFJ74DRAFT_37380 [Hyaloraphidium curvatum]